MKSYFYLSIPQKHHLALGIGDDLGHLFMKAIVKCAGLGQLQNEYLAESSAWDPTLNYFMSEIAMKPFPFKIDLGLFSTLIPELVLKSNQWRLPSNTWLL